MYHSLAINSNIITLTNVSQLYQGGMVFKLFFCSLFTHWDSSGQYSKCVVLRILKMLSEHFLFTISTQNEWLQIATSACLYSSLSDSTMPTQSTYLWNRNFNARATLQHAHSMRKHFWMNVIASIKPKDYQ